MTKRLFPLVFCSLFILSCHSPGADVPKVGDTVWAQWVPDGWYHGKIDKKSDVGLHVAFDDGDQADRAIALIAVDSAPKKKDVDVGTHLLALVAESEDCKCQAELG